MFNAVCAVVSFSKWSLFFTAKLWSGLILIKNSTVEKLEELIARLHVFLTLEFDGDEKSA